VFQRKRSFAYSTRGDSPETEADDSRRGAGSALSRNLVVIVVRLRRRRSESLCVGRRPANGREKRVLDGVAERYPLRRFVVEHAQDEVKQRALFFVVRLHVPLHSTRKRFTA